MIAEEPRGVEKINNPVLRYHGGKWKLAPWIIEHIPPHRTYVEPYGGAASVLMQKPRSRAEVYNDLEAEVVNVFRVLRDPELSQRLEELIALTPYSREEFDHSYEETQDPVEQARRTIVRGFLGCSTRGTTGAHRTGFRYSDSGGTVAEKVWARYPERIAAFCRRLQGVVIECKPALDVIRRIDSKADGPNAFYLVDPPYVHSTRSKGSHYRRAYKCEMTDQDHTDLSEVLHSIKGAAIVCGYRCSLYDDIYGDWMRIDKRAYADGSQPRVESIWLCPKTALYHQAKLLLGEVRP